MRNFLQADRCRQVWAVAQNLNDAAIVGLEELLEHQTREELVLSEIFAAETAGIGDQRFPRHRQCFQRDLPWRLAGAAHPSSSTDAKDDALPNMRRTYQGFYRAFLTLLFPDADFFHASRCAAVQKI